MNLLRKYKINKIYPITYTDDEKKDIESIKLLILKSSIRRYVNKKEIIIDLLKWDHLLVKNNMCPDDGELFLKYMCFDILKISDCVITFDYPIMGG